MIDTSSSDLYAEMMLKTNRWSQMLNFFPNYLNLYDKKLPPSYSLNHHFPYSPVQQLQLLIYLGML